MLITTAFDFPGYGTGVWVRPVSSEAKRSTTHSSLSGSSLIKTPMSSA